MTTYYHVTILSNFAKGFDKYKKEYSKKNIHQSTFPNQFFLLKEDELHIGIDKANKLLRKTNVVGDQLIVISTKVNNNNLYNDHESKVAQYIKSNSIELENVFYYIDSKLVKKQVEEVMAHSLHIIEPTLIPWKELVPRTISVLPIALACQASCKFCFSKASVSSEFSGKIKNWDRIDAVLTQAKKAGATRAVITGGGEPTLIPHKDLLKLISICSTRYSKTVIITNGVKLSKDSTRLDKLKDMQNAGLKVLAISRHHYDAKQNAHVMGIDNQTELICNEFKNNELNNIQLRLICVIQKEGVKDTDSIEKYLTWASNNGVQQVNFKELYVSTTEESAYSSMDANTYSAKNQVSLKIIQDFVDKHNWEKIYELPWGAPIFQGQWNGMSMQIAAYTEPSVFWERTNRICRSWNMMSNGLTLASLEDTNSHI